MEKIKTIQRISENIDGIGIIDYVEETKKFEELTDFTISIDTKYYPWVVINYINHLTNLTEEHNIPHEFEFINVIWAKHIGVAHEIICYGKIHKERFEERVREIFENSSGDRTGNDIDYLNIKEKCLNDLQIELEHYMMKYIPGIFLSQNVADMEQNEPKCISFWTYRLEDEYNPLKIESTDSDAEKVHKWIKKFDSDAPTPSGGVHKDSYLSLLGWKTRPQDDTISFSLINRNFIVGPGGVKDDEMGRYTNKYIIFSLLSEKEEKKESGWSDPTHFQYFIIELSKFLLSFSLIRYRFKKLEEANVKLGNYMSELLRLDKKLHGKKIEELSQKLEKFLECYDNKKEDSDQNLKRFSQIDDEIEYLKSLRNSLSEFTNEDTSKDSTKILLAILKDTDFWFDKISRKLEEVKSKDAEILEYIHRMIDVSSSFINVKLQEDINKLTKWLFRLTVVIVFLTIVMIGLSPQFGGFVMWIKKYVNLSLLIGGKL